MAKKTRHSLYKAQYKAKKRALAESLPPEVLPVRPAWKFDRVVTAEVGALLLLPLVAFWVMRFVPVNQNLFLDPYVYTGYINNFQDLMARYGVTYYSVRFGLIVPGQWFTQLFGPEGGYFTFRYVLAVTAALPLYYVVKRRFSQPVAVLTVAGMVTSPYFARALLWDHPDATGVPFLTAAMCLVLLDDQPAWWRDTLAGVCAAMAIHSNFFTIALVGIFGMVWLFFSVLFRQSPIEVMKRFAGVVAGALLITALGYLYYWHAMGQRTDIFSVTLGMASSLQGGLAKQWRVPGTAWIATQLHVLIPILLGVCCILAIRWRRISFTSAVVVGFGVAATAFFYLEQFYLDSDVLQLFYYFSYLIPAVFLMLALLFEMLWERTQRAAVFLGLGLAVLLAPWLLAIWAGRPALSLTEPHWLELGGVVAVTMFLATRDWRLPALRNILPYFALVLLGGCFTAGLADYNGLVAGPATKKTEMNVYRVAQQFMHVVPKLAEHPGVIRFWYNNRIGNSINSVQSTFLWGFSKLNTNPPEDPGMPHLGDFQLQLLRDPQVRYLGLLGETEEELSQGLTALQREGIDFKTTDHRVLASGDYRVYYQLVELTHGHDFVPSAVSN